jgi:pyruvate/2-oxoglutarate dehydrogenase complex dihydrolipoamide dehydrogenase (E3) component
MTKMKSYDLIVLGGGSAGYAAARTAKALGKSVAVVDGAKELGGLCILAGCMPSKTLLWSTEVLHLAQRAKEFGLKIPEARVDMTALQARKKKIIGEFAEYRAGQLTSGKYDLFRSQAKFVDAHTVELADGTRLRGEKFVVATGSRVSVPAIPGLAETPFWTSDDILNLDTLQESVIVLGGGIVACELAQFLRRAGVRVIQIQRGAQLLKEHSPEAAAVVAEAFREEGVELFMDTTITGITGDKSGVTVKFTHSGKTVTKKAARLFNALGREPNVAGLGLDAAGVKLARDGKIKTDRFQRTSAPHIYAGGDVCGPYEIVHLAVMQGEIAAKHAFGVTGVKPIDYSLLLGVVFTDPALATIGLSEKAAREKYGDDAVLAASYPFNDHGKSILMGVTRGFVKVIAEKKRARILGAEIVGPQAGELIHCFSGPLAMRATVHDLLRAPWYHPTLAEILTYPLEEIADALA